MTILIEHSGTQEHLEAAELIKDRLEDDYFEATVETAVGDENNPITIYKNGKVLYTYKNVPTPEDVAQTLKFLIEDK